MKLLPPVSTTPEQEASLWLVRELQGFTLAERARFEAWKDHPAHAQAYERIKSNWSYCNAPRGKGQAGALQAILERRKQKRRTGWWVASTLAAAALAVFAALPHVVTPPKAPTVAFRPDKQFLPDGSVVELNSGATISVDFSGTERKVKLLQGEALFSVAKNPARPFVVSAGAVDVTAVGTVFTVRNSDTRVRVLVTEGKVRVARANMPEPLFVTVGEQVVVGATLPPAPQSIDPVGLARELAWRGKRVEFTDTPLAEALALFNEQNPFHVEIADPSLTQVRLNGIYWADDPEGFVRLLEDGLGLKAVPASGGVSLQKK